MNAPATFPGHDAAALPSPRTARHDGWTPERQRAFLESVAGGCTVDAACRHVGLSVASAYAFRRRAAGSAFALGWRAASLLARDRIADALTARAIDGQVETITRPDGSTVSRHRYDNRLATAMLTRLDRMADDPDPAAHTHAARLAAQEFDAFLDLIGCDAGPARAGLFLATRAERDAADLAPVTALARADRYLRTGAGLAAEIDVADCDPARRHQWTADQWQRAEAAGLVTLAAPVEDAAPDPQLPQLHPDRDDLDAPVWWDEEEKEWRTRFPPPPSGEGFCEDGTFGDPDYSRTLTDAEDALIAVEERLARDGETDTGLAERARWFAGLAATLPAAAVDRLAGCGVCARLDDLAAGIALEGRSPDGSASAPPDDWIKVERPVSAVATPAPAVTAPPATAAKRSDPPG